MDEMKPESVDSTTSRTGPGVLLRQARQDLRLAPEDVAQILHLSSKQIIALEADDYQHLPGPTYVRGYLRSYAQLLGLAPEKIVDVYNSFTVPPRPISLPQSAPPPQVTSGDRLVKIVTLGLAAIGLSLVYLWWSSEEAHEPVRPPADITEQVPAEISVGSGTPSSSASSAPDVVEPTPSIGTGAAPAVPTPQNQAAVTKPENIVPPTEDRATAQTRRTPDIPPGVPRARLVLHAMQESWADIRDARDNKLLYENVPAGRRITIEGMAPFSVFLGNADGVRVEFNGQNYDVSRHKRGQVARFTLGEETR